MLLHYLKEIENSNFLQIFSRYERKCKQIAFKCKDFNSYMRMTVAYTECIYVFFIKILSSSLNIMLIVEKHCCDVCCNEFPVTQIDRNVKQVKQQWHGTWKILFAISRPMGKTRYFKHRKYQICGWITKLEATKVQNCLHFLPYLLNICRKFEFLICQATCLRWVG